MKTSEVFRLAQSRLWDGKKNIDYSTKDQFICHAIENLVYVPSGAKDRAKEILQKLLFPHYSFEEWLERKHKILSWKNMEKTQQTRHAWLYHLIEHYESIGY